MVEPTEQEIVEMYNAIRKKSAKADNNSSVTKDKVSSASPGVRRADISLLVGDRLLHYRKMRQSFLDKRKLKEVNK